MSGTEIEDAPELVVTENRAVLLDENSEREWRASLGAKPVIISPAGDWHPAAAWLDAHLATPAARDVCAAWAGARLQMEADAVLAVSAPLRAEFSARLHRTAERCEPIVRGTTTHAPHECSRRDLQNAASVCAEVLGWALRMVHEPAARLAAWATLAPHETLPALILDARTDLAAALTQGDALARFGFPTALRAEPAEWQRFLASERWDRAAARWRNTPAFSAATPLATTPREIPAPATAQLIHRDAPDAAPLLAEAAARIAREKAAGADAVSPEERSAAEALLHAVLDARPLTRGRFTLNAALDFAFGLRAAEGDLVAAGARLVVEIDGYYHFRDTDGYRRDRRKDAALQEHGWFVLRFLADDVVCDLENVVARIETQLARRDLARPAR